MNPDGSPMTTAQCRRRIANWTYVAFLALLGLIFFAAKDMPWWVAIPGGGVLGFVFVRGIIQGHLWAGAHAICALRDTSQGSSR